MGNSECKIVSSNGSGIAVNFQLDYDRNDGYKPILKRYKGEIEYNYRYFRTLEDSLADWQGFNRAVWILGDNGESLINAAKLYIDEYISNMQDYQTKGKLHAAYWSMYKLAKDYIRHYHADFHCHDTLYLSGFYTDDVPPDSFLWMIRETGTHIMPLKDTYNKNSWGYACIEYERKDRGNHFYYYDAIEDPHNLTGITFYELVTSLIPYWELKAD